MHAQRRLATGLFILAAVCLTTLPSAAQERGNDQARPSPNAGISQTIGTTRIDLQYGRPAVRGRTIFGDLQPWGEPWRAGANEPTTIVISKDVRVEGEPLEAGMYNIFMRPMQDGDWDVIFTTPVRWGTMYDQATPVIQVSVTPKEAPLQEWLTYQFEDLTDTSATLVMHWERTMVPVTISTAE
jgi:hypothetical protein